MRHTGTRGGGRGPTRRPAAFLALLVIAWCVVGGTPASATVVLPADFATVVAESTTIVHGRVVDVRSDRWGPLRSIESLVTVTVVEAVKGTAATTVTFRIPGGRVGRYRRVVVGAPEFEPGDEVVLFLKGRPPESPSLVGLSQGVYRVHRSSEGAVVLPAPAIAPGRLTTGRGSPERRPVPVEAFIHGVRESLGTGP